MLDPTSKSISDRLFLDDFILILLWGLGGVSKYNHRKEQHKPLSECLLTCLASPKVSMRSSARPHLSTWASRTALHSKAFLFTLPSPGQGGRGSSPGQATCELTPFFGRPSLGMPNSFSFYLGSSWSWPVDRVLPVYPAAKVFSVTFWPFT